MRAFSVLFGAIAALTAAPVQAWWDNGHMLVGEIASQLLSTQDRTTIQSVLSDWDRSFPNTKTIATAAIWPDLIKCAKNSTSCTTPLLPSVSVMDTWHYMNLPLNANGSQWGSAAPDLALFKSSFGGAAVDTVEKLLATINTSQSLWSANYALRLIIHVIADVHQPLHAVAAVSEKYPGGDSGGNLYTFKAPCLSTNLHALYDAAGGEYTTNWAVNTDNIMPVLQKNASELIMTIPLLTDNIDLSSLQSLAYPQFSSAFVSGSYFRKFVLESYQLATAVVYPGINKTFDGNGNVDCPSADYIAEVTKLAKQRIALAGKRLAIVLAKVAQQLRANKLAA